jgi:hypothetical protein
LRLYSVPLADFALETATIGIGLALYARSLDPPRSIRAGLMAMAAVMIGLQVVWNFGMHSG